MYRFRSSARYAVWTGILLSLYPLRMVAAQIAGEAALGTRSYADYERPQVCQSCHNDFYRQWKQSMMSQAYTHHWDEIEYFDLAVAHSLNDPAFEHTHEGCNGCHTPMAFFAGDVPPPRPEEQSRANESVSCDICHTITGIDGEIPFNFNFISSPGRTKYGPKPGLKSPHHDTEQNEFLRTARFCGACHNEKSGFGVWVKSTQLEWEAGPYAKENVPCHRCHAPHAHGRSASMGEVAEVAQHLFHGAHDPGKVGGAVELRMHPSEREVEFTDAVVISVQLFNAKAGHKIPTGSVEDRIVWLEVTATDIEGRSWRLPVDPKGFSGEEYTIAADVLAYQDMGVPLGKPEFPGLARDGVPVGCRVFRMPYFDPQGRMTIMQWNTAALGVDYRLGPRETKIETYTWQLPDDIALGRVELSAQLNYQKLMTPVAEFLNVPSDESAVIVVNRATSWFEVYD